MSHPTYTLNPEGAKSVASSQRISETGAYSGVITRAEAVTSDNGTLGVELAFIATDGCSADYLRLWTVNASGKELYGRKVMDALMTCLRTRTCTPTLAMVEKYDRNAGGVTKVQATVFPELMNKPIGLVLQRETYEGSDGNEKERMLIYAPFEATTERTAREVLEKAIEATGLEKLLAGLHDRVASPRNNSTRSAATAQRSATPPDDSDIPW